MITEFKNDLDLVNENHNLTLFFNNSAMSKLLDLFLDNPDLYINITDILKTTGLSRKSIWINIPKLLKNNILLEEQDGWWKYYKLNTKNDQVKQISKFRDILYYNVDDKPRSTDKKSSSHRKQDR